MFDISWTEFLLIGVVALVVIGPKELPAVMRTLGQWTRKVRGMAADFQNQFQEALREAEMADLKQQVDDMAQGIKNYDPLKDVRDDFEAIGKDVEAPPQAVAATAETAAASAAEPAAEIPVAAATAAHGDEDIVGAGAGAVAPAAAEQTVRPQSTGHTG